MLSNLQRIRHLVISISLFSMVVWPLFTSGTHELFGPIKLEPILFGISTALRIVTVMVIALIFFSTTRIEELTWGLNRLGLPYNVCFAFATAMRLIPTVLEMTQTIIQAQTSRGLDLQAGSFITRVRKYVPLLIPIIIMSIRSTNRLAMAVEAKGFGARKQRTHYLEIAFGNLDVLMITVSICLLGTAFDFMIQGAFSIDGLIR